MTKKIKTEVEQFKKQNGNSDYTQKELTMYLVRKIDAVTDKLNAGEGKINENRIRLKGLSRMINWAGIALLSVLGFMFVQILLLWKAI